MIARLLASARRSSEERSDTRLQLVQQSPDTNLSARFTIPLPEACLVWKQMRSKDLVQTPSARAESLSGHQNAEDRA